MSDLQAQWKKLGTRFDAFSQRERALLAAAVVGGVLLIGFTLLIDPMSYQYLVGAEIDYSEGLEGSQFVIRNPNATSTCGCGSSFSA